MKSVLLSIKPEYCRLITSGQKTVEIRQSRPKMDTPFKCYIYCTKNKTTHDLLELHTDDGKIKKMNGKVIGEFVCDKISTYAIEWCGGFAEPVYQDIREIYYDDDLEEETATLVVSNEMTDSELKKCSLLVDSCLSFDNIGKYVCGKKDFGFHTFYGWHISNLQIYDKPKELSEFYSKCDDYNSCAVCKHRKYLCVDENEFGLYCDCDGYRPLSRPPQSWRYIEELDEIWSVKND